MTRKLFGLSAAILAGCVAAAPGGPGEPRFAAHPHAGSRAAGPSTFDFMVLASMADSRHPLAMAGYGSKQRQAKLEQ